MKELIPMRYASNTWKGFALRVATIAIAALVVLGVIDLFEYLHDTPRPRTTDTRHEQAPSLQETNP